MPDPVLSDEVVGAIHQSVWASCMEHKMQPNEAASVANRAVLRLRELGYYPKKSGSGAPCVNGCVLQLEDYRDRCAVSCKLVSHG